jgi:uncharacterized protein (TIGR03437 family)
MHTSATRGFYLSFIFSLGLCGWLLFVGNVESSRRPRKSTGGVKAATLQRKQSRRVVRQKKPVNPQSALRIPQLPERYDQPGEAAEFFRDKRLPAGAANLPIEKYFEAQEQMRMMPQYSTSEDRLLPARSVMTEIERSALPAWTPLGPNNIGGRTRALLIHPTNPEIMYAASVSGGVWKTTNGGQLWSPLADLITNIAVNSLVMDPKNPSVIYAGTGEGYFNIGFVRGAGIFRTTDGGATWTQVASTATEDFYFTNDIVISPTNSQRLYAATRTGVWRSVDGGATWARTLNPKNSRNETVLGGCLDLAIRTDKTTDYVFAACGTILDQGTVYRNTDAAGSGQWTPVLSEYGMGRASLSIAPSDQSIVYAAAASITQGDYLDGLHAVFRSTGSGDAGTWTGQVRNGDPIKLNTVLFSNPLVAFLRECNQDTSNFFANQGWYDNAIAVDPTNPNIVFVGGIDLFRSDDGGVNWGMASHWWAEKSAPQYAHADQHSIVFHPRYNGTTNQTIFVANDGGVFRSDNARDTVAIGATAACNPVNSAVRWTALNNGYGVTQFYHGLPYPDGAGYFGGTQDNGTLRGTDAEGGNSWREILGGDGGYVAINESNPKIQYASTPGRRIRKSLDGGVTFNLAIDGISDEYAIFINPFVMDPSDPQRLWTGGGWLWRTNDGAVSWERASALTAGQGLVSAIAVAPTDADRVLVGMTAGEILRTDIGLTSLGGTAFPYRTPRSGYVSWVAFDPTNANIAYATYSTFGGSHVFRSTDGGANWTAIDGTGANKLPDIPVHCIVVDPGNPARLYIGTDLGVFVSTDSGGNWAVENTGFANVVTESLSINVVNGATNLYAFTHGRGAWRVSTGTSGCKYLLSATGQSFDAVGGSGSVNLTPAPGSCNWTANVNASGAGWITINSGSNGSGNGTVSFTIAANNNANPRSGTIAIAGRSFVVKQAGIPCAYTLSSNSQSFEAAGGTGNVNVTTGTGCTWIAYSNASWITVNSNYSNSGNGTVSFTTAANTTDIPRAGDLSIAGQIFRISQAGNTSCTYSISPGSQSFTASGGTSSVNVTAGSGCKWQAISTTTNPTWITINSGNTNGTGNGTVNFTVSANNDRFTRAGALLIGGQTFTVTQAARSCPSAPITLGQTVNGRLESADCRSDYSSYYIYFDLYSFSGTAGQTVMLAKDSPRYSYYSLIDPGGSDVYSSSTGYLYTLPMSGTYYLRVASEYATDYTLSLLPVTSGCKYSLSSNELNAGPASGTGSINLTTSSGCAWQAASHANWITINSGSRSGNGSSSVTFNIAPNTGISGREGNLYVAGQYFRVSQAGNYNNCTVTPISPGQSINGALTYSDCYVGNGYYADLYSFSATAGQIADILLQRQSFTYLTLFGPDGAAIAYGSNNRITNALPVSGNYVVRLEYSSPINYTLSLGIALPGCRFQLSPVGGYFAASGGAGSVNLATSGNCVWNAISGDNWIKVNSSSTGNGHGIVSYSITANDSTSSRSGALSIGGQTFTVTQAGQSCPQTISLNQTVSATFGGSNCSRYAFSASAGEAISLALSVNGFVPTLRLLAPNGTVVVNDTNRSGNSAFRQIPAGGGFINLPNSGTYILEIESRSSLSPPSTYTLILHRGTPGCAYAISQSHQSFASVGGSVNVGVTTEGSCEWQVFSDANWITFNSNIGKGNGIVNISVPANTSNSSRGGTLLIAGRSFSIYQSGLSNNCILTPITIGQPVSGGLSTTDCRSPARGSSYYADRYSFNGTAGQLIAISHASSDFDAYLYLIGSDESVLERDDDGGTNGNSRIPPGSSFFMLPSSGTYIIEATSYGDNRTGNYTLSLIAKTDCNFSLSSVSQSFSAAGGTGSIGVTTQSDCKWLAAGNAPWVKVGSGSPGAGNGTVNYTVEANHSPSQRTGTISLGNQTFTITQAGRPCAPTPINSGQPVNGTLATDDCASLAFESTAYYSDRYTFTGAAGQLVTFALNSTQFDPYLYLIGPNGAVLTEDDDGGVGLNARIPAGNGYFALPAGGEYTIEVTSFDPAATGNYTLTATLTGALASVSAASFSATELASESIVAAFGVGLATTTQIATTLPLPTDLAGTKVTVRDNAGMAYDAPLFFVSAAQVNYLMPAGLALGPATVTITSGDGRISAGTVSISTIAPALFTANASGQGMATGVAFRVKAGGQQSFEEIVRYDQAQGKFVAVPIDLGPESDQVFLILFGTGLRYRSSLTTTTAKIGGINSDVLYAGSQGGFAGLDQINLHLSRSLIGRGEVDVGLTTDGKITNQVKVNFK